MNTNFKPYWPDNQEAYDLWAKRQAELTYQNIKKQENNMNTETFFQERLIDVLKDIRDELIIQSELSKKRVELLDESVHYQVENKLITEDTFDRLMGFYETKDE